LKDKKTRGESDHERVCRVVGDALVDEDAPTAELVRSLRHVWRKGEFDRDEFLAMCRWKSPRVLPLCRRNEARRVRRVSRAALGERDEARRLDHLRSLRGVGIPVASSILTLLAPGRYGVLDVRAWGALRALGGVDGPRHPGALRPEHWVAYTASLRRIARSLRTTPRRVEFTLYMLHSDVARGAW
jgi:hypothetical protein